MRTVAIGLSAFLLISTAAFADVFVPEGGAGTTLHLNDDFEVVGRIEGLAAVHGLAIAKNRGMLVAGSLSEIDRSDIKKPEAVSEAEHEVHHGGKKMDPSAAVSIVSLVDIASHKITKRVEVPGMVHHVEVSADERFAAVTHPTLDAVSIIDIDKGMVTATIVTGPTPEYAIADPATGRFFVSNAGNATISEIDPEAGILLRNFKLKSGPKHMQLLADQRALVVAEADEGMVSVISTETGEELNRFDVGGELHGIQAEGNMIYVSARERDLIVAINTTTGEMTETNVGPEPYHMALVGDALMVSSAENPLIWVLDKETFAVRKTVKTAARAHQMAIDPDS